MMSSIVGSSSQQMMPIGATSKGLSLNVDGDNTLHLTDCKISVQTTVNNYQCAEVPPVAKEKREPAPSRESSTAQDNGVNAAVEGEESPQPNEERSHQFHIAIWIDGWRIISVFGKSKDILKEVQRELEEKGNSIDIYPEKGEIAVTEGIELKTYFKCESPPGLKIENLGKGNPLLLNDRLLQKEKLVMYFKPSLKQKVEKRKQNCEVYYYAIAMKEDITFDDVEAFVPFVWPSTVPDEVTATDDGTPTSATPTQTHIEKLYVVGDAHIATRNSQVDRRSHPSAASEPSERPDASSNHKQFSEIRSLITDAVKKCFDKTATETNDIGPSGGSVKLDGCEVDIPPGLGDENIAIKMVVANNSSLPTQNSLTAVSRALKCKPSDLGGGVKLKLESFLHPKEGKKLTVLIMTRAGDQDWKEVGKIHLLLNNEIEFEVPHFCWYVAMVTEEEEKNGEYHLFNDVWMDCKTGIIASLFCKDKISFKQASKAFGKDYKSILPLSEELIVSIGDIVNVTFDAPSDTKIEGVDSTDAQISITHENMKNNFFLLLFKQVEQFGASRAEDATGVSYNVLVYAEDDNQTREELSVPLDISDFPQDKRKCSEPKMDQEMGAIRRKEWEERITKDTMPDEGISKHIVLTGLDMPQTSSKRGTQDKVMGMKKDIGEETPEAASPNKKQKLELVQSQSFRQSRNAKLKAEDETKKVNTSKEMKRVADSTECSMNPSTTKKPEGKDRPREEEVDSRSLTPKPIKMVSWRDSNLITNKTFLSLGAEDQLRELESSGEKSLTPKLSRMHSDVLSNEPSSSGASGAMDQPLKDFLRSPCFKMKLCSGVDLSWILMSLGLTMREIHLDLRQIQAFFLDGSIPDLSTLIKFGMLVYLALPEDLPEHAAREILAAIDFPRASLNTLVMCGARLDANSLKLLHQIIRDKVSSRIDLTNCKDKDGKLLPRETFREEFHNPIVKIGPPGQKEEDEEDHEMDFPVSDIELPRIKDVVTMLEEKKLEVSRSNTPGKVTSASEGEADVMTRAVVMDEVDIQLWYENSTAMHDVVLDVRLKQQPHNFKEFLHLLEHSVIHGIDVRGCFDESFKIERILKSLNKNGSLKKSKKPHKVRVDLRENPLGQQSVAILGLMHKTGSISHLALTVPENQVIKLQEKLSSSNPIVSDVRHFTRDILRAIDNSSSKLEALVLDGTVMDPDTGKVLSRIIWDNKIASLLNLTESKISFRGEASRKRIQKGKLSMDDFYQPSGSRYPVSLSMPSSSDDEEVKNPRTLVEKQTNASKIVGNIETEHPTKQTCFSASPCFKVKLCGNYVDGDVYTIFTGLLDRKDKIHLDLRHIEEGLSKMTISDISTSYLPGLIKDGMLVYLALPEDLPTCPAWEILAAINASPTSLNTLIMRGATLDASSMKLLQQIIHDKKVSSLLDLTNCKEENGKLLSRETFRKEFHDPIVKTGPPDQKEEDEEDHEMDFSVSDIKLPRIKDVVTMLEEKRLEVSQWNTLDKVTSTSEGEADVMTGAVVTDEVDIQLWYMNSTAMHEMVLDVRLKQQPHNFKEFLHLLEHSIIHSIDVRGCFDESSTVKRILKSLNNNGSLRKSKKPHKVRLDLRENPLNQQGVNILRLWLETRLISHLALTVPKNQVIQHQEVISRFNPIIPDIPHFTRDILRAIDKSSSQLEALVLDGTVLDDSTCLMLSHIIRDNKIASLLNLSQSKIPFGGEASGKMPIMSIKGKPSTHTDLYEPTAGLFPWSSLDVSHMRPPSKSSSDRGERDSLKPDTIRIQKGKPSMHTVFYDPTVTSFQGPFVDPSYMISPSTSIRYRGERGSLISDMLKNQRALVKKQANPSKIVGSTETGRPTKQAKDLRSSSPTRAMDLARHAWPRAWPHQYK